MDLSWKEKSVALKWEWKIHGARRSSAQIQWIECSFLNIKGLGEVSGPSTVPSEKYKEIWLSWEKGSRGIGSPNFKNALLHLSERDDKEKALEDLSTILAPFHPIDSIQSSVYCGLETAIINWLCQQWNCSIASLFKYSEPTATATSFSIPLMDVKELPLFFQIFSVENFEILKVKITHSTSKDFLKELSRMHKGLFRFDGNQCFQSRAEVLDFLDQNNNMNIELLEQPLEVGQVKEQKALKRHCPVPLVADESLQRQGNIGELAAGFHGINIKLMKSGGLIHAIQQIESAKALGLDILVGCMIESSLSIANGLTLAEKARWVDLDGFLFLKQDPFHRVLLKSDGKLYLQ